MADLRSADLKRLSICLKRFNLYERAFALCAWHLKTSTGALQHLLGREREFMDGCQLQESSLRHRAVAQPSFGGAKPCKGRSHARAGGVSCRPCRAHGRCVRADLHEGHVMPQSERCERFIGRDVAVKRRGQASWSLPSENRVSQAICGHNLQCVSSFAKTSSGAGSSWRH